MKIITHGCSFTKNHLPCWPKFVEWFTDHEVVNRGYADSSNETISRDAINSAIEFKSGISHMYIMWSANDKFEYYKTLEHILRTQHFLSNYSLRYTMMICKQSVLSDIEHNLYNEIDWDKFIFYNQNKGLHEYSLDNFKEYYNPGDLHPPPIAHYYWTKNIIFQSEMFAPKDKLDTLEYSFNNTDNNRDKKDGRYRL